MEAFGYATQESRINTERKVQIRSLVARTLRMKRTEVLALMKEYDKVDPKNKGTIVSTLVNLLKNNQEFRVKFAELAVSGPSKAKAKTAKEKHSTFYAADGATLASEIKETMDDTTEAEMEKAVDGDRVCSYGKIAVYAAVAIGLFIVLRKL